MKRLTKRYSDGQVDLVCENCPHHYKRCYESGGEYVEYDCGAVAAKRLADYEDTGLTPKDIIKLKELRLSNKQTLTREQYHEMAEKFFDEFNEGNTNEETALKCMLIGLAFGKLELMLFGEDGDNNVKT